MLWYYQVYNGSSYVNMTWQTGFGGAWQGSEQYSLIRGGWFHPGNSVDAVLKWVAPSNGTWQITGTVNDADGNCGDGVAVKILHGNTSIWSQTIANGAAAQSHDLTRAISTGEAIYFVVNKRADNGCDSTGWNPTISYIGP